MDVYNFIRISYYFQIILIYFGLIKILLKYYWGIITLIELISNNLELAIWLAVSTYFYEGIKKIF